MGPAYWFKIIMNNCTEFLATDIGGETAISLLKPLDIFSIGVSQS
jgi:hypothetical protein